MGRIRGWAQAGAFLVLASAVQVVAQTPASAPSAHVPDPAAGQDSFQDRCSACHVLNGVGQGPNLIGVVGRPAASWPGFHYTEALKTSGLTWTPENLSAFLAGPSKMVPGTAMPMIVPNPDERADIIAYLATLKPGAAVPAPAN